MTPIHAVVVAVALMVGAQGSSTAGSIVGCISDTRGQPLPRATVAATGAGVQRSTVADNAGCYELKDLPAASYRVTARFSGFDNVTRDRLVVAASSATHHDVTTQMSPICECIQITGSLPVHLDHAAAVLHLRLSDSKQNPSTPDGSLATPRR